MEGRGNALPEGNGDAVAPKSAGKAFCHGLVGGARGTMEHVTFQTVATGVAGDPKEPGKRSGGAVKRKRERFRLRRYVASSLKYHNSPRCMPSSPRHFLVDRQAVVVLSVGPVRIGEALDREIVGNEDGDAALVDPFEKAAVAPVEYGVAITEDIGVQACLPCR